MEQQRLLVVQEHEGGASIAELADAYEVSRKTIYKWIERYLEKGASGLLDQSRRPHTSPQQVSAEVAAKIVAARLRWKWGRRKLLVKLAAEEPSRSWPAVSTVAAVLKAKGLIVDRRRRTHTPVQKPPYAPSDSPNQVWCGISRVGFAPPMECAWTH